MDLYIYLPEEHLSVNVDAVRNDLERLRYFVGEIVATRSPDGSRFAVIHTADPDNVFAQDILEVLSKVGSPVDSVDYVVRALF